MRYVKYIISSLVLVFIVIGINACATKNQYDNLHAKKMQDITLETPHAKKRLGIAFGGGGVRGFVHLGVIKAFEEAGLRADVVTGTSAGSIAATLYASGLSYAEIEKAVLELDESDIQDFTLSGDGGFIQGQKLAEWIQETTSHAKIEDAEITLGIAVTDLTNSEALLITEGDMGEAAQTSSTIPGAFVPVNSNGKILVDGGVLSLVPVKFNRALGADVVVGVDIYCGKIKPPEERVMSIAINATRVQACKISEYEVQDADFMIRPKYEPESYGNFDSKEESIQAGYEATKKYLEQIKAKL